MIQKVFPTFSSSIGRTSDLLLIFLLRTMPFSLYFNLYLFYVVINYSLYEIPSFGRDSISKLFKTILFVMFRNEEFGRRISQLKPRYSIKIPFLLHLRTSLKIT